MSCWIHSWDRKAIMQIHFWSQLLKQLCELQQLSPKIRINSFVWRLSKWRCTGKYKWGLKHCLHVSRLDASFAALRSSTSTNFPLGFQLFLFFPCFTFPSAYISHSAFLVLLETMRKSLWTGWWQKSTARSSFTDFWNDWMVFAARIGRLWFHHLWNEG